jgi:hypothetical protein
MSIVVQRRRDTRTNCEAATPLDGEIWVDQTLKTLRVGDGVTLGGLKLKKWGSAYTLSPAQITADQNDYNPTDLALAEAAILDLNADRSITGLATGATNRELVIYNTSAFRLTMVNESGLSTAANRFHINTDLVLRPYQAARLLYSATLSRWLVIGRADLGITDLPENLTISGDISPAQIAANTNDYNPAGLSLASRLRLSTDASRNLTGIVGGADGRVLILVNVGTNALVLKDADVGSTAANRFDFGADVTLTSKQVAVVQYDATDSRWKMIANTAGAAVADLGVVASKLGDSALGLFAGFLNGTLSISNNGTALTCAVKTLAGTDPTNADPVLAVFRNVTLTSANYVVRRITGALSFAFSAGSSGGFNSGVPGRVYWVLFDDAGTVRLGAINCWNGTDIFQLGGNGIASSTAEGGAGAADNAHTFYTGVAVANKPYTVIARSSWETALAAAGTWNANPDVTELIGPSSKLPGDMVQDRIVATGSVATGTTQIPQDDTIPQNTEGDQYMSVSITPRSKCHVLDLEAQFVGTCASAGNMALALFQDTTANAIIANTFFVSTSGAIISDRILHRMLAGISTATTFKARGGPDGSGGTLTFNGRTGGRIFGGVMNSFMRVTERMA